jgi:1D-myo-inositol-tetrakisphosphate 5-kinase/inositol-polyphosphate multikinase
LAAELFIKLEDITRNFKFPCIMDVKIGPVTYDCHASPDKVAREKAKFPALDDVGFQLGGVKVGSYADSYNFCLVTL